MPYGLKLLVCVLLGWVAPTHAALAQETEPPNIVWLVVEDMSPWLACYGDDTVPTPNLDRLAEQGVRYTNAFATSPVCAPARSSIITGMFATRIGSMQMRNGQPSPAAIEKDPEAYADIPGYEAVPPAFVRCFPEHLRAAGYYCTNNSKQDYQFRCPVGVWDASNNQAHWRNRAEGQPFFAVFNHGGTHESQAFPESHRRPQAVAPEDVSIPPFYPDTPAVRDAIARTYNNIAAMDRWIGDRLRELEEAGLLDSTIVMFYSDHGVGLPRGKRSCYDTGTRVPLIIRDPDQHAAGTTDDTVVSFVDLGPTVLSLTGIEPDDRLDGTPFLGEYAYERNDYRRGYAYSHADRFDAVYDRVRSVSDGRYRYVRNDITDQPYIIANAYRERIPMTHDLYALREPGAQTTPEQWQMSATQRPREEFYDTQRDPWEVHNLAEDPDYAQRIDTLRGALDAWIEDTGDLGFVLPETVLVREHLWPPDGEQPTTAVGQVDYEILQQGGGMFYRFELSCDTEGASIAYRLGTSRRDMGPWRVYTGGAIDTPGNMRFLEVNTHRIGYKPMQTGVLLGGE
ncbi:MAG: sulfatase [Phycisphaerales bacterium JB063]